MPRSDQKTCPRVLSVGQCGFDHRAIAAFLGDCFGADVEAADSLNEVRQSLHSGCFDLVLVNRLLDLDGSSGLDVIRSLRDDPTLVGVPVMPVSNHPRFQEAACELGAYLGFGKAELDSSQTFERLKALLG
jgi:CheY-like chemotaxis protein